jgi:hypothetical protein
MRQVNRNNTIDRLLLLHSSIDEQNFGVRRLLSSKKRKDTSNGNGRENNLATSSL